eukprot:scaffold1982_cov115-Isochrysis_galbana.AAC.4
MRTPPSLPYAHSAHSPIPLPAARKLQAFRRVISATRYACHPFAAATASHACATRRAACPGSSASLSSSTLSSGSRGRVAASLAADRQLTWTDNPK